MKRCLSVLIALLLIMSFWCNPVYAAAQIYDLDELNLRVTIPSGYSVITKETPADDPIFEKCGTTKTALLEQFQTDDIYLNAISDDYSNEIVVIMTESYLTDFGLLSDTVIELLASNWIDTYTARGVHITETEIYQNSQGKFLKFDFWDFVNNAHGVNYCTVYDGKAMNFAIRTSQFGVTAQQKRTIQSIVDSIVYDHPPLPTQPPEETGSFVYTDQESGVSFTIPANWKQGTFTEERENLDVGFVSTKENGLVMTYGSVDVWEEATFFDRLGHTRSDFNNSLFTKEDVAEIYNTTADKISVITYNGVVYFKGEIDWNVGENGKDFFIPMTCLLRFDNGWMYMFQFGAKRDNQLYSEFESLLRSVIYPVATNETQLASKKNDTGMDNVLLSILIGLLAVVIVMVIVAVIFSKKKAKANTIATDAYELQPPSTPKTLTICKNCGQSLPHDGVFCHICGTKIDKEN